MRTPAVYGAKRVEGDRPQATLPQAIRPAVEIIARLSAERARLRAEVARFRAQSSESGIREELAKVTAERDALRAEVERLRTSRPAVPPVSPVANTEPSPALRRLVERLERSLGRLETATRDVEEISGQFGRTNLPARSGGVARPRREQARAAAPSGPLSGNGMMASLLRQNLSLRDGSAPAETTRASRPAPAAAPTGGMLGALARQNAELRQAAPTQRRASMATTPANPLAGLVAENKALRRTSRRAHVRTRAA
jgi:hypothetical protein